MHNKNLIDDILLRKNYRSKDINDRKNNLQKNNISNERILDKINVNKSLIDSIYAKKSIGNAGKNNKFMLNRSVDKIEELKRSGNSTNFARSKSALKDLNVSSYYNNGNAKSSFGNSNISSNGNLNRNYTSKANKVDLGTLRINSSVYAFKANNLQH